MPRPIVAIHARQTGTAAGRLSRQLRLHFKSTLRQQGQACNALQRKMPFDEGTCQGFRKRKTGFRKKGCRTRFRSFIFPGNQQLPSDNRFRENSSKNQQPLPQFIRLPKRRFHIPSTHVYFLKSFLIIAILDFPSGTNRFVNHKK